MQPSTYVPSFYFYKLAQAISAPYTDLIAFKSGNIDSQGNIIKSVSSIDAFEFLVIKLKKIFEQLPYGITKASLSNYLATLQMFSEEVEKYDITQEQFHCLVEGIVSQNTNNEISYLELLEDMATGGGAGALGVPAQGGNINQGGISGRDIRMGLPIMKRKKGDFFDNCEVFDVCPAEFVSFKNAKNWTDIPESETKRYLQRFQRRNKNGKMGISGINPVSGEKDLFWITYPSHNFMESKDLSVLNFLFEESKELTPDKNSDGKTSTEEVRAYFQDRNLDGSPDGEHHSSVTTSLNEIFGIGKKDNTPGVLQQEKPHEASYTELQGRLLAFGHGLDQIHTIEDSKDRHAALTDFLSQQSKISRKSASHPDPTSGDVELPDAYHYDIAQKKSVPLEIKSATASGSFPTKLPEMGKKLRPKEWIQKLGSFIAKNFELTGRGRYRERLSPEQSLDLEVEAGRGLVRFGKKTGSQTLIKSHKTGNFYFVDTPEIMSHWVDSLRFPSVKARSRGESVEQSDPSTAGSKIELAPLKGFISRVEKSPERKRLTISKRAYQTMRESLPKELHIHLDRAIGQHVD